MTSGGLLCFAALMNFAVDGFGDLWGLLWWFGLLSWVFCCIVVGFLGLVFLWFCVDDFLLCCMRRVWRTTLDLLCGAV